MLKRPVSFQRLSSCFPWENAEELLSWLGGSHQSFCLPSSSRGSVCCLVSSWDYPSCVEQCTWPEFTPTELALWQHNRSPAGHSHLWFYSMCSSPFSSNTVLIVQSISVRVWRLFKMNTLKEMQSNTLLYSVLLCMNWLNSVLDMFIGHVNNLQLLNTFSVNDLKVFIQSSI